MKNRETEVWEAQMRMVRQRVRGHRLEALVSLALTTGMRRDEVRLLQWSNVDLQGGVVHVWSTKTGAVRVIHLSHDSLCAMRKQASWMAEQQEGYRITRSGTAFVFPDETGEALSERRFVTMWHALLKDIRVVSFQFHAVRFRCGLPLC